MNAKRTTKAKNSTTKPFVLDTNVLVSLYVFTDSRFAPLRARIESGAWQAITNDACFGEFRRVLGYPLFALTEAQQANALDAYAASTARPCSVRCAPDALPPPGWVATSACAKQRFITSTSSHARR